MASYASREEQGIEYRLMGLLLHLKTFELAVSDPKNWNHSAFSGQESSTVEEKILQSGADATEASSSTAPLRSFYFRCGKVKQKSSQTLCRKKKAGGK